MQRKQLDPELLEAALAGLEHQRGQIDAKIAQLRSMTGGRAAKRGPAAKGGVTRAKRVLSPAARQRIAEAQRKRWAAFRKTKPAGRKAGRGGRPRTAAAGAASTAEE